MQALRDLMAGAPQALSAAPRASHARATEGLRRGSMAGDESLLMHCAGRGLMAGEARAKARGLMA